MANRGKNLLEVFKASGAGNAPSSASSAPSSAGAPSPSPSRGSGLAALAGAPRGSITLRPAQLQLLLLVQVVLVVLAFLLGRNSGVSAAEPSEVGSAGVTTIDKGEGDAPTEGRTETPRSEKIVPSSLDPLAAQEAALLDRVNFYTVKAVEYSNTEAHQKLARATLSYLSEVHKLPACVTRNGTRLFVLIGAAPRQVDLDDVLRTVRRINGPPPGSRAAEFHDAYVEKIDTVFPRK